MCKRFRFCGRSVSSGRPQASADRTWSPAGYRPLDHCPWGSLSDPRHAGSLRVFQRECFLLSFPCGSEQFPLRPHTHTHTHIHTHTSISRVRTPVSCQHSRFQDQSPPWDHDCCAEWWRGLCEPDLGNPHDSQGGSHSTFRTGTQLCPQNP